MAKKWTRTEYNLKYTELKQLYVKENKSLFQIATILGLKQTTVYDRLVKFSIPITRHLKPNFNNQNNAIAIPKESALLAEFIGCMLGDGHITPTQVTVTLGYKEPYVPYVCWMVEKLFKVIPKSKSSGLKSYHVVYFGSTKIVKWLLDMGLVYNKVNKQVAIPEWCFKNKSYIRATIRGLMDTDGSIYKMGTSAQMSFTNKSVPLLKNTQLMLQLLGFSPSKISANKIYLTKKSDLIKYWKEIGFKNPKHIKRFHQFT